MSIKEFESASNALTKEGAILDSIDRYYADNCRFIEPDGSSRDSKAAQRVFLEGFFSSLKSFDGATLHNETVGENSSMSEWTFKMTAGDGSPIVWHEVLVREWQNDKIVSEKFYTQG